MDIKDQKDLATLLKLCRKQGIREIELGPVKIKFGDMPEELVASKSRTTDEDEIPTDNPYANFPSGILTPTQLAYYSAGGDPSEDPELAAGDQ